MSIHPLSLYLGYIGITIPFCFGIAAIISKDNIGQKTFLEIKSELKALDKILNTKSGINFISNFKRINNWMLTQLKG